LPASVQSASARKPSSPSRSDPPHRQQHRLRRRLHPGPAAAPDLARDDVEADDQLRSPVRGVRHRGGRNSKPFVWLSTGRLPQWPRLCLGQRLPVLGRIDSHQVKKPARPNRPASDGEATNNEAASVAAPQVAADASVDASSAPNAAIRSYAGVSGRSALANSASERRSR
jgi:hypothetical protein